MFIKSEKNKGYKNKVIKFMIEIETIFHNFTPDQDRAGRFLLCWIIPHCMIILHSAYICTKPENVSVNTSKILHAITARSRSGLFVILPKQSFILFCIEKQTKNLHKLRSNTAMSLLLAKSHFRIIHFKIISYFSVTKREKRRVKKKKKNRVSIIWQKEPKVFATF